MQSLERRKEAEPNRYFTTAARSKENTGMPVLSPMVDGFLDYLKTNAMLFPGPVSLESIAKQPKAYEHLLGFYIDHCRNPFDKLELAMAVLKREITIKPAVTNEIIELVKAREGIMHDQGFDQLNKWFLLVAHVPALQDEVKNRRLTSQKAASALLHLEEICSEAPDGTIEPILKSAYWILRRKQVLSGDKKKIVKALANKPIKLFQRKPAGLL